MKIAILTSPNQWFVFYAKKLNQLIKNSKIFYNHAEIINFDIVFILSYHKIINKKFLKQNKHNFIIQVSNLIQEKPCTMKNNNEITFSLFKIDKKTSDMKNLFTKKLKLNGLELCEELKEKQARFIINMCLEFLKLYFDTQTKQIKEINFYSKKNLKDDQSKNLKKQFNLLHLLNTLVNNKELALFFYKNGKKFILNIYTKTTNKNKPLTLILENYTYLSKNTKEKLRFYRNHPKVKKYLYTTHYISKLEHKCFIQKLKKTNKKNYFCVSYNQKILGSINFEKISNNTASFGFFGNPYTADIGVGFIFEYLALFYCFYVINCKKIYIEVAKDNKSVLLLHKKFNFTQLKSSKKITKLELHKNNSFFKPFLFF